METSFEIPFDGGVFAGDSAGLGLPVVFLHSDLTDRRLWQSQMQELAAAGYHVISYDRRGFGESASEDVPFNHLVDLEAVLDRLSIHAAILVGVADGGALAIDFALENPERTVGLVLVSTGITGAPEPELPEEAEQLLDALAYSEERGQAGTVANIEAHLWLDGPLSPSGRVDGEERDLFLRMSRDRLGKPRLTQEEERDSVVENVASITAPVLLVAGELDFPHVLERHEDLSEEMENAFAVVLEDTAHLPNLERPDLFNPLLLEFLEAVSGEGDIGDDEDED
jgi:pimeloyl-ACP methyl ester carboxylesterase